MRWIPNESNPNPAQSYGMPMLYSMYFTGCGLNPRHPRLLDEQTQFLAVLDSTSLSIVDDHQRPRVIDRPVPKLVVQHLEI